MTTRFLMVTGVFSISVSVMIGWLVYLNLQQLSESKASGNKNITTGGNTYTGEILCEFTWEKDPVTSATLGPDGVSCNSSAVSALGGRAGTKGLALNSNDKSVELVLQGGPYFNQDGIDISIDYKGSDKDGYFFYRSNGLQFGLEGNRITVSFRVENERGGFSTVKELTDYECIHDGQYRTYRFNYTPATGHSEITVNGAPVWIFNGTANRALYWKNSGDLIIGQSLSSEGGAFLDNLVIRSTGSVSPLAASLINFMLEGDQDDVTVHFTTTNEDLVASYSIERSMNGTDFQKISTITPGTLPKVNDEYLIKDIHPNPNGVIYYRLRQQFKNGKFVLHPLSAIRLKSDKGFSIDRINPQPFSNTFDVSYFLPKSGRVWVQLIDEKGTVKSSKTFEAKAGKNVHVHQEDPQLPRGNYTLNIIFENKKVSSRIIKS
ncbi:MAG: T9SS type A sorting domain-containing protein [Bacteroidota bacterium]